MCGDGLWTCRHVEVVVFGLALGRLLVINSPTYILVLPRYYLGSSTTHSRTRQLWIIAFA